MDSAREITQLVDRRGQVDGDPVDLAAELDLVGAENPVTSRDLHVFVYEAAEAISSQRPNGRLGGRRSAARRRELME